MLIRFWRWLINPNPQPDQFWILDGVGEVQVFSVNYDFNHISFYGPIPGWKLSEFRKQAIPAWHRRIPYQEHCEK